MRSPARRRRLVCRWPYTLAMATPPTVVDLFAGAGGLSEGFERTGFRTVAAVEQDRLAAATFQINRPTVDLFEGDIVDWLERGTPPADVVIGGPPCQGFSNLGARQVRDPRNALWRRYVDALVSIEPLYFVLENVSDFLRSGQYQGLYRETYRNGRLRNYRVESAILNAAHFGAAQIRKRAVVIGSRRDLPPVGAAVGALTGRPASWTTVRSAIGNLDFQVDQIALPSTRTQRNGEVLRGPFKTTELHVGRRPTELSLQRYAAIPEGGNRNNLPDHLLAACWRGHRGASCDVMGRLRWDRPSVTIRTEFWKPEKGRYLHPEADRALTHLEAARLQGFPDDYLWFGSKIGIGRQIGNAVPVRLAQGIASHLAAQFAGAEAWSMHGSS
jgi:DNA (cytosine-5)-methyltransferase 1